MLNRKEMEPLMRSMPTGRNKLIVSRCDPCKPIVLTYTKTEPLPPARPLEMARRVLDLLDHIEHRRRRDHDDR